MRLTLPDAVPVPGIPGAFEYHLGSVAETLDIADGRAGTRLVENAEEGDDCSGRPADLFTGGETMASLRRQLGASGSRFADRVVEMRRRIEDAVEAPTRRRRRVRRDLEDGAELDPSAVLERRADGWSDVERARVVKHVVTVAVNVAALSHVRSESLIPRGAAAAAAADIFSAMGHSVEVIAFAATVGPALGVEQMLCRIAVKPADAPMNVDSLSTALCSAAFFRIGVLGSRCRVSPTRVKSGLGRTRLLRPDERLGVDVLIDADVFTEAHAEDAVRKEITAFAASKGRGTC